MHNAPPVNYPVGRSRFQAVLISVWALVCLWVGVLWALQPGAPLVFIAVFGGLCCVAAAWALRDWHATPEGQLAWDGESWSYWRQSPKFSRIASPRSEGAALGSRPSVLALTAGDIQTQFKPQVMLDLRGHVVARLDRTDVAPRVLAWVWLERRQSPLLWHSLRCALMAGPPKPARRDTPRVLHPNVAP